MSDDPVRSIVETDEGALDFQDYFVRRQCKPVFRGVRFQGGEFAAAERRSSRCARPRAGCRHHALQSIRQHRSDSGIAGDQRRAAPIATAGRRGFADRRRQGGQGTARQDDERARRRAVGARRGAALRPAGRRLGRSTSVDRALAPSIEALGCRVKVCNTIMRTLDEKAKLAQDAVQLACEMAGETVG